MIYEKCRYSGFPVQSLNGNLLHQFLPLGCRIIDRGIIHPIDDRIQVSIQKVGYHLPHLVQWVYRFVNEKEPRNERTATICVLNLKLVFG